MSSKFYIKRGTHIQYDNNPKTEGELFYLTDKQKLASCNKIYDTLVDGGYFKDRCCRKKTEGTDGGEF